MKIPLHPLIPLLICTALCGAAVDDPPAALNIAPSMTEAKAAYEQGDFARAEKLARETLERIRTDGGGSHPAFGVVQCNLAFVLGKLGRAEEAVATFRQGHALLRQRLGDEHPSVFSLAIEFADVLQETREHAAVVDLFRELEPKLAQSKEMSPALRGSFMDKLARALAALNRNEEALRVYKAAHDQFAKTQGGAGADLVRVALAMDALRAKLGLPAQRKFVGNLGMPSAIEISGAKTFTSDDLRFALAGSYAYLLAAHPSAPFDSYAVTVETELVKGYRNAGFRDARVTAVTSKAGDRLLVQIDEGRKFVQGDIRITGVPAALAQDLIDVLTDKPKPAVSTLADRVSQFIEEHAAPKRQAEAEKLATKLARQVPSFGTGKAGLVDLSASNTITNFVGLAGISFQAEERTSPFWKSGDPFSFAAMTPNAAASEIGRILVARGKSLVGVRAGTIEDEATGRVHLVYQLTDAPNAVVGDIFVEGNKRDSAADIIAASGLKKGGPFTNETIRDANLALWNTARFLNFDLTPAQRSGARPEVDITIEVEDEQDMPPLREPLTRENQALVRLANWMTFEFPKREVALRFSADAGGEAALAVAPGAGMALLLKTQAEGQMIGIRAGENSGLLVAASGQRTAARDFGIAGGTVVVRLSIVPGQRGDSQRNDFLFGLNYSSKGERNGGERVPLRTDILIAPEALCSRAGDRFGAPKFENGFVRYELDRDKAKPGVRFVEATGELIEIGGSVPESDPKSFLHSASWSLGVKPGEVARLGEAMEDAKRGHDPARLEEQSVLELIATSPVGMQLLAAFTPNENLKTSGISARVLEKALTAILSPILSEALKPPDPKDDKPQFFIPIDPGAPTSAWATIIGAMYFQFAQDLWPPDAWPAKLGREIFYVATGNTTYTPLVLDELYKDPQMGPLGSKVTAELLKKTDPASARRFLRRAGERSSVEDLRRELDLLLNVRGKGSGVVKSLVGDFGAMDLESIELLAGILGPEFAAEVRAWRMEFATTQDKPPVEVLMPYLLRGWERGGRAKFVGEIDAMLAKDGPDPWNVAAMVDGEPVSRKWLDNIGPALRIQELLPPRPIPTGGKPGDVRQQVLDGLIALRLVQHDFIQKGGKISPELQQKTLEWISRGNTSALEKQLTSAQTTQAELPLLLQQLVCYQALIESYRISLKPPTEENMAAAIKEKLKEFATRIHLKFIRSPKAGAGRAALERLRTQVATKGFQALWDAVSAKKEGGLETGDYEDLDRATLNEALTDAAFALDVGQTGKVVESGDFCYLLHVVSKGASEKAVALARQALERNLAQERLMTAVAAQVERLRARAAIDLVDLPPVPSAPPPPQGATRLEGEALKVLAVQNAQMRVMSMEQWGAKHWSGGKQVLVNGQDGGWVEWEFEAPEGRNFQLVLHATRALNFGKITVAIDGQKIGDPVDLYAGAGVIPSGPRTLGERELSKGTHQLRISVQQGHPESTALDFGLDALDLIPTASRGLEILKAK